MPPLITRPEPASIRTWGILAYVDATERDRLLNLPAPQRKRALAELEKLVRRR